MSADNWTTCPKCAQIKTRESETALAKAKKMYGKVPADEYLKLVKDAETLSPAKQSAEETLREDYEIGVRDGVFIVSFGCSCFVCNFEFNYHFKEALKV